MLAVKSRQPLVWYFLSEDLHPSKKEGQTAFYSLPLSKGAQKWGLLPQIPVYFQRQSSLSSLFMRLPQDTEAHLLQFSIPLGRDYLCQVQADMKVRFAKRSSMWSRNIPQLLPGEASVWLVQLLWSLGHKGFHPKLKIQEECTSPNNTTWLVIGADPPDFQNMARHPAGVQNREVATSNEPCWCNNYKSWYLFPNDSNWKCKYSQSTLKIAHYSSCIRGLFPMQSSQDRLSGFPANSQPFCFAFQLFFLLSPEMQTVRSERRKMEGNSCTAHQPCLDLFILQAVN